MDDVLNPRLVWVKGSCFRVLDHDQGGGTSAATYDGPDLYEAEFSTAADAGIEDDEFIGIPGLTIEATSDGQHLAKVPVAAAFYPRIIGKGGQTRRRIETETSTRINVPKTAGKPGKGEEPVSILGASESGVRKACNRISVIMDAARAKMDFTHFVSVPLNAPQIMEAFENFKAKVLGLSSSSSPDGLSDGGKEAVVTESHFQPASSLHLTFAMLTLLDDRERQLASNVLQQCLDTVIKPALGSKQLKIRISGLEIMNDDPSEVDVLYAKASVANPDQVERDVLQRIADQIAETFYKAGLKRRDHDRVKLHATLVNSKFPSRNVGPASSASSCIQASRCKFDARDILANFADHFFGVVDLKEVHVSQRKVTARPGLDNVYYPATAKILVD